MKWICSIAVLLFALDGLAQNPRVNIRVDGDYRYITSNGIPNHATGQFPNANNPNRITEQNHSWKVPVHPKQAASVTPLRLFPFGVGTNGIPFDPGAAEFWNRDFNSGWQYEPMSGTPNLGLDQNLAHVQPTGAYHYHGLPPFSMPRGEGMNQMVLAGWAADGFPIYIQFGHADANDLLSPLKYMRSSYRMKRGARPGGDAGPGGRHSGIFVQDYEYIKGAGDLDECNGRFGKTPEFPQGTYHYFLTEAFPFIPRYFHGTPDISFQRGSPGNGPPGAGRGGPGGRRPPPGGFGGRRPPRR